VHLAHNIWISGPQFDTVTSLSKTVSQLTKNLALAVFGSTVLRNSSVTGNVSNKNKKKKQGELEDIPRPKLNGTKFRGIKGILI
ncbi:hypothetical protein ALC62_05873, partial [Cyphomyrmex costatus]